MIIDYASANGDELWNTARLQAYLENVGSPFDSGPGVCRCPSLTPEVLGAEGPYTVPDAEVEPAPWYDPAVPASAEFLGFMPLTVEGTQDNPRGRIVTGAVGGGGVFGPARDQPRTITVTGVVIGSTCCGAAYGMQFLSQVLAGCSGGSCDGDCFEMYNCCPGEGMTPVQFNAAHRRTYRRTSLVSGPTVLGTTSSGSCDRSACAAGAELIDVEFVLVAATPWAWTDPVPVLEVTPPIGGGGDCIEWCLSSATSGPNSCDPAVCLFQACVKGGDPCGDPRNPVPSPPTPKVPVGAYCAPLGPERACYDFDISDRPQWASDVPVIQVYSGATELRNIRVTIYEKQDGTSLTCDQVADRNLCNPVQDFLVSYIPARTTVTLDGAIGRATVNCNGSCGTASTAYGNQDGGPVQLSELTCASYCVCIETDTGFPPSPDAVVYLSVVGKGY